MSSAELVEVKQQLAKLYTAQDGEDTEVRVTLYQIMKASMNISTSLSDAAVCEVFMQALTFDDYSATCTAAVSGDKYTFTLEYPLEPAVQVAAKTAEMMSLVVTATFTEKMAAAAANLRLRRLVALSVARVDPPTTYVLTRVTIVVKVLASRVDAYQWLQFLIRVVQERAGSVTASMIRAALMAAPGSPWGLVVTTPALTVTETNAPPATPPKLLPPSPPPLSPPPPSPSAPPPSSPPPPSLPPRLPLPRPPSATPTAAAAIDVLPTLKQNGDFDSGLVAGVGVIAGLTVLAMLLGAYLFIIKLCRGPRWRAPLWEDELATLQTQTI